MGINVGDGVVRIIGDTASVDRSVQGLGSNSTKVRRLITAVAAQTTTLQSILAFPSF